MKDLTNKRVSKLSDLVLKNIGLRTELTTAISFMWQFDKYVEKHIDTLFIYTGEQLAHLLLIWEIETEEIEQQILNP